MTSTIGPSPVDPEVQRLIAAVDGHRTGDSREAASRAEILVDLRSLDKPFDRHDDLTHVTASGIVIGPRGVLLHRHRRHHQPGFGLLHRGVRRLNSCERAGLDVGGFEVVDDDDKFSVLAGVQLGEGLGRDVGLDRKSTRLNSSH